MKIDIITLTYNGLKKATIPFVESLYKYTDIKMFNLIIVDNGSNDGTVEYLENLKKEKNNVRVIYNKENLGYSRANNQGLKIATEEYVGLFNNDILMTPDWISPIFDIFQTENSAGLVCPTMLIESRAATGKYCKKEDYLSKALYLKDNSKSRYEEIYDAQFSCVIFKRELTETVGYLDENLSPAFFEDDDYTYRVSIKGYKNFSSNLSYYFHACGNTSSLVKNEIFERNMNYIKEKEYLAYAYNKLFNENERFKYDLKYTIWYWIRYILKRFLGKE